MKKSERINQNRDRVRELSDIVNILIGRLAKLEHEVERMSEEINKHTWCWTMAVSFSVTFDSRSKEILLDSLKKELSAAEEAIRGGDYSTEALIRHEEVLQLVRGILYSKPIQPTVDKGEEWCYPEAILHSK